MNLDEFKEQLQEDEARDKNRGVNRNLIVYRKPLIELIREKLNGPVRVFGFCRHDSHLGAVED